MKLPFYACPSCHKDFRANVQNPEQNVRCPHCKNVVHLPKKPASKWFLARGKEKIGPLTLNQLQALADKGELERDTMLLKDGDGLWVRAGEFPLLFPQPSATHTAPRYSRRFMIAVSSIVLILLIGGGWIVFSGQRAPGKGTYAQINKNGKKEIDNPPQKNGKNPSKKPKAPPPDISNVARQAIHKINRIRNEAGAPTVEFDVQLSEACEAHAKYIAKNPSLPKTAWRDEHPKHDGFSEKGKRAARWSFVFLKEPLAKIDDAMADPRMRASLINPRLEKIGIGFAQSKKHGDILVVDAKRGEGDTVVVYPGPGQTDVATGGIIKPYAHGPAPVVSFPITVQFPTHYSIANVNAHLAHKNGREALYVQTRESSIVLFRKRPFAAQTRYTVRFQANVNGQAWTKDWHFTTGGVDGNDGKNLFGQVLAKINDYRKQAGLPAVVVDGRLADACSRHAEYLVRNAGTAATQGDNVYTEIPGRDGYSVTGLEAAKRSNVLLGKVEPAQAIDTWMASFYHRLGLLNPNLQRVGIGIAHDGSNRLWATVVDVQSKRAAVPVSKTPVIYPLPDQAQVPRSFRKVGDVFDPIPRDPNKAAGFPITIHFPGNIRPTQVQTNLSDSDGKVVPCHVSYPGRPANPNYSRFQFNTICLIAHEPLRPHTKYRVHVQANVNTKPWSKTWHFTTQSNAKNPPVEQDGAVERVIAKINDCRESAGLSPVRLDPRYANGCQAHADYLLINNSEMDDLSQEDEMKDGFSKEGRKAGNRAFIRLRLTSPEAMIDDYMRRPHLRSFLLDPQWRLAGVGCAHDPVRGWITVLDALGDREFFVTHPVKDQKGVGLFGREPKPRRILDTVPILVQPSRTGYPITFTFLQSIANPRFELLQQVPGGWARVPLLEHDASIRHTVQIIPAEPLQPGTRYRVSLSVLFGDWDWMTNSWEFTTKE